MVFPVALFYSIAQNELVYVLSELKISSILVKFQYGIMIKFKLFALQIFKFYFISYLRFKKAFNTIKKWNLFKVLYSIEPLLPIIAKSYFWIVNTKLDNFFKVFKFVLNGTHITKCSMNSYVIKPVDIVM
jgi:hypothetical protein